MKKIIFAVMALAIGLVATAQEKSERAANIITISGGIGYGSWTISNNDYSLSDNRGNGSSVFNLAYQHVWRKGFGIGANMAFINYDIAGDGKDKESIAYLGPAAVYNYTTSKGWRWNAMLGLGFANDPDIGNLGLGGYFGGGVDYKINTKFGIGLQYQEYISGFPYRDAYVTFYNMHIALCLNYYF